jgi:NAD(P)-dependent dehydrogenase (short-subunit alcohol dehydrogenase family)
MNVRYDNRVAIVTGAGNGLGRSHALGLAERGAKVVVNDLGTARDGTGGSSVAAEAVVEEIRAKGGEAIANGANVAAVDQVAAMVAEAKAKWGRIDILVNNAGILRDKSFAKMDLADFRLVVDVHLMGAVNCTKAVWEIMREQNYGRIVLTSSGSGIYGNFGQSNYAAAKAAMIGLMNVLHVEGVKNNIRVNTLLPTAATRMTADLLPPAMLQLMAPEAITPAVLYLVGENAPSRVIMGAGAGVYAVTHIMESEGVYLPAADRSPEAITANFSEIADVRTAKSISGAAEQTDRYIRKASAALGITMPEPV